MWSWSTQKWRDESETCRLRLQHAFKSCTTFLPFTPTSARRRRCSKQSSSAWNGQEKRYGATDALSRSRSGKTATHMAQDSGHLDNARSSLPECSQVCSARSVARRADCTLRSLVLRGTHILFWLTFKLFLTFF